MTDPTRPWSHLDRDDPRIHVLRLLADGVISTAKACEAVNALAAGEVPILPQLIDPDEHDDGVTWTARVARAAAIRAETWREAAEIANRENFCRCATRALLTEEFRRRAEAMEEPR